MVLIHFAMADSVGLEIIEKTEAIPGFLGLTIDHKMMMLNAITSWQHGTDALKMSNDYGRPDGDISHAWTHGSGHKVVVHILTGWWGRDQQGWIVWAENNELDPAIKVLDYILNDYINEGQKEETDDNE